MATESRTGDSLFHVCLCWKALLVRGCWWYGDPPTHKTFCFLPVLIWRMPLAWRTDLMWKLCLSLDTWLSPGWPSARFPDCSLSPAAHTAAKTCARHSALGPCCYIWSLMVGARHLMQIRVCPWAPHPMCFLYLKYSRADSSLGAFSILHTAIWILFPFLFPLPSSTSVPATQGSSRATCLKKGNIPRNPYSRAGCV